jgi:hypothetical protein
MAKRTTSSTSSKTKPAAAAPVAKTPKVAASVEVTGSTPVRKTVTPRKSAPSTSVALTHDLIAERAYYIAMSGKGGTESENWYRAERELKAELGLV